jgi:hypothetical protein
MTSKENKSQSINRQKMLILLNVGLNTMAYRFTRQAALAWLTSFPGDLEINLMYARALMKEERFSHAAPVIQKILRADPEYAEAAILGELIFSKSDPSYVPFAAGTVRALGGTPQNIDQVPAWGEKINSIRRAIAGGQYETARGQIFEIMGDAENVELVSFYHLLIAEKLEDATSLKNLARLYHNRWPDCIQIALILAKVWMDTGEEDEAVNLLHFCAANDPMGLVPARLWGKNHPYVQIYPQGMQIELDLPIPAEVAGKLGLNQLSAGKPTAVGSVGADHSRTEVRSFDGYRVTPTVTETYPVHPKIQQEVKKKKDPVVEQVEEQLKEVASDLGQQVLTHTDERFPAHVILTMKSGLQNQYGQQNAGVILDEMKTLAKTVQDTAGWTSIVFLPDDLEICGKYNITPVDALDPWKIKLALVDLDKTLEKTGERIGSVLIVGGDEVVPFHRLPNPTDDADSEVPSDTPYGALDTNYFIPDWPVGRLPGEAGSDAGLLLEQIRNAAQYHAEEPNSSSILDSLFRILFFWNQPWMQNFSNIGYSASVWKRSSLATFRPVGEGRNLFLSPNGKSAPFDVRKLSSAQIGYFNVHGVEDGNEWYGQKDAVEGDIGPDFPVALTPSDLQAVNSLPRIVFSEACYGGHLFEKTEDESIALTMLGKGVMAMIGSTTIAYGSVTTPLIGSDLLGYLVLKNLRDGLSVGSSMVNAKVEFVREMNRRQGYLDGEDQKTLISFILYGDPLVAYDPYLSVKKVVPRNLYQPAIKTISDSPALDVQTEKLAPKMILQAKNMVKEYLPGIDYAEVRVKNQQINASGGGWGKSAGSSSSHSSGRVVVSFSKQVTQAERVHMQYARVTLDKQGKMVKLAVSR